MDSGKLEQDMAQTVCDQVKSYNNIDPSQINAFFSRLQPQAMSEGFLMLTADNDFIKTWIERHYVDFIKQALHRPLPHSFHRSDRGRHHHGSKLGQQRRGSRPRFRR